VGDHVYFDIYGAHQVGMKGVWFKQETQNAHTFVPGKLKKHPHLRPDKTIHGLAELPKWLEQQ
jgi:FMN phosphatase YigB (HAD superfamily)